MGLAGLLAAVVPFLFVVGGVTLASWSASAAFAAATIDSGRFALTKPSPDQFTWVNQTNPATGMSVETLASHQVAPQDVLELRQTVHTEFAGENLATRLSLSWPDLPEGAVVQWRVENPGGEVLTPGGWADGSTAFASDEFLAEPPIGIHDYVVALRLSLPATNTAYGTGDPIDLGEFVITAQQIREGPGFVSPPGSSSLWSDSVSTVLSVSTLPTPDVVWTVTNLLTGSGAERVPADARFPVTVGGVAVPGRTGTVELAPEITDPAVVVNGKPTTASGTPISGLYWDQPTYVIDTDTHTVTVTWRSVLGGLINSLATSTPTGAARDIDTSDGICSTGALVTVGGVTKYECTLLAAIQQANAGGLDLVTVDPDFAGGTILLASNTGHRMNTSSTGTGNSTGAYYHITRAGVTVDLQNRVNFTTNDVVGAGFLIDAANVTVQNMTGSNVGEDLIVVTANGDGATIDNITYDTTTNYYNENIVVVLGGADGVTISNNTITGVVDATYANVFVAYSASASTPITNLTITGNTYIGGRGGTCGASNTTGCSTPFFGVYAATGSGTSTTTVLQDAVISNNTINGFNQGSSTINRMFNLRGATLTNLRIEDNLFSDIKPGSYPLIDLYATKSQGLLISGNQFLNVTGGTTRDNPVIQVYDNTFQGTNMIADNTFQASCTVKNAGYAIHVDGNTPTTASSSATDGHLAITDNSFDGFGYAGTTSTLLSYQIAVDFGRNTFGTCSNPAASMTDEENRSAGYQHALIDNYDTSGNSMMQTWYPTALSNDGTTVQLTVTKPSSVTGGGLNPSAPVLLDVYWTVEKTAEVYVGSYAVDSGTSAVLSIPAGLVPSGGYLRVLTHKDFGTSQFSRTIANLVLVVPQAAVSVVGVAGETPAASTPGSVEPSAEPSAAPTPSGVPAPSGVPTPSEVPSAEPVSSSTPTPSVSQGDTPADVPESAPGSASSEPVASDTPDSSEQDPYSAP